MQEIPSKIFGNREGNGGDMFLRISVWAGVAGFVLVAVCLGYLLSQNLGSRNIALATGALAGAAILLCVQLLFELRPDEWTDFITAKYTIDRATPGIRQWEYGRDEGVRPGMEFAASNTFAAVHPGQFNGDREKLTRDMVIFSLFAYLGAEQFDWQMKRTQFVGQLATLTTTSPGSRSHECTNVTKDQLRQMLLRTGNVFADANMFFGQQFLCLPPKSAIEVTADAVVLKNPFCDITFALESSGSVSYYQPGTNAMEQPILANGEPSLETRPTGIRVTVHCHAMRAQHSDMPKYKDWSNRVVSGAQNWFMGERLLSPPIKAVRELEATLQREMEKLRREISTLQKGPAKN